MRARPLAEADFGRSAVVFAPHQDDEVLGCGGTILRKRAAGARIEIVFLTDGRNSHKHLLPVKELKTLRRREAVNAAAAMGIGERDVHFFDVPDGDLAGHRNEASLQIRHLLEDVRPDEIFVPARWEPPADHVAANQIVRQTLRKWRMKATLYEYPVWLWHALPWVRFEYEGRRRLASQLAQMIQVLGRFLLHFNCRVDIRRVLDAKKAALAKHETQMARRNGDSRWLTLGDVGDGDFLQCFFRDHEIFYRYQYA